tara:strand:+ start:27 stop:422 length:396 start_codon:yes stop_codon:yes gene_type:complete
VVLIAAGGKPMRLKERLLTPYIFEHSKVPVWLSYVAPITINAISLGPFVFARRSLNETSRRHETIHYRQQLELLFVFQWILYLVFWLWGLVKYRDAKRAYYRNPFEQEAYDNEHDPRYLNNRSMHAWLLYV